MEKSKEEQDKLEPPKATSGDSVHLLVTAVLSTIPAASELFQYFVTPPLEKRRQEWMEEVAEVLRDLERNRGIRLEDLQSNEDFIDTVLHATQIAIRNARKEKRNALRNALINAALPNHLEHPMQTMFLDLIDVFNVWHIRLLQLFHEPARHSELKEYGHYDELTGGLAVLLEKVFPELRGQRELYDQIWRDLYTRGLIDTESLHSIIVKKGILASRTTRLGKAFVNYILEPKKN